MNQEGKDDILLVCIYYMFYMLCAQEAVSGVPSAQ
ncbi:hypothetical protein CLOBOL_03434 [Enterocloster bolteae ATCC BAA-613]|uniref:Uncharacterized protein n=1 Tax=Enterocloster bolteae (strain ATCC BAA-613 / DSM 15670 / CCUG 46953 / JCM 12243 / WAL 16351) TaxID=411902 RepID=A8RST5_ENTBW|nr:hypothetical protein CLOBOL_03434 [Enterocloster bolteae ATCC BAA-613]